MLFSQGIAPMENEDWFQQLPLFVAVSLGGGLLGAIFNAAHKAMFKARPSHVLMSAAVTSQGVVAGPHVSSIRHATAHQQSCIRMRGADLQCYGNIWEPGSQVF